MMRKWLLVGALGVGLIAPHAYAQSVQNTLTGNETWNAGQGPGGTGRYITSNLVRGSEPHALATIGGATTLSNSFRFGGNLIITAQPSAAVITTPSSPVADGAVVGVCNGTASAFATNAVTMAANTGQTLKQTITLTTLAAGICQKLQYNLSNTTWYRIQ
jgi:hypothetical protein